MIINNAGIMPLGAFVDEDDATAQRMIDINLHGVIFGMKLALPGMLRRNSGHIVNIASQAGKAGFPGGATYCATKHAVVGLSEAVRAETPRDRDRGLLRDAGRGQHRARLGPGRVTRRQGQPSPRTSRPRSCGRCKYPKFDVFVPRGTGVIYQVTAAAAARAAARAIARALKADQVLADADAERARRLRGRAPPDSEPGLEPEASRTPTRSSPRPS